MKWCWRGRVWKMDRVEYVSGVGTENYRSGHWGNERDLYFRFAAISCNFALDFERKYDIQDVVLGMKMFGIMQYADNVL